MQETAYAADSGMGLVLFLWVAFYFFFAFTQFKIAQKVGHESPWWAWVPILNFFQQIQMAGKEWYWFLLCLVPVVNIFVIAAIWMEIARNCRQSAAWGIMAIIPILNFIALPYLAFSSDASVPPPPPAEAPRQHESVV
ncbi:MAG: hypothetical protein GY865_02740 [candidate division Zixibacteria bacterium]|nr:hypothetical protein [candidate division Zixibacteria bacterium]